MAKILLPTQREIDIIFQSTKFQVSTLQTVSESNATEALVTGADTMHAAISIFKTGLKVNAFGALISGTDLYNSINNWDNISTIDKVTTITGALSSAAIFLNPISALAFGALTLGLSMYAFAEGDEVASAAVDGLIDTVGNAIGDTWQDATSLLDLADSKAQTPAEKIQQINNPIIIKESQAGNPIDQFTFDTATQALSPWKNGNIVDLNDQGELFVNDPDVAFSDIGDLFDAEEAMLQELQEGLITYEEFSAFQDYVLDYSLDDYVFEPNYNFDEYAYDPIGAFYDSQSEEYDNALSIASHTGVLLDANNQALSIAQLQALDTNNDGQLSTNETTSLNLWTDLNEDGHLNTGELVNLSTLNQPIQQSDYGFYTQGNGLVATNQPNQANQATEPTTPDSNYRHLRDTINFIGTYNGVILWGVDDIKIDEGRTHMLIGTDGNDEVNINTNKNTILANNNRLVFINVKSYNQGQTLKAA
ncbi:hypothetical protein [Candidatus Thiodubiliella endoseptemdiera]|uniref:hypothetical protein n=1 Tax=Candidatus Thiodubiliella endoseptemdiera TaxID=2738886 RepID=UPI0034DE1311